MRFGIMASGQHPEGMPDPSELRAVAHGAERLGFDSLWVGDHLSFKNPILEGIVALTALAAWTEAIALGTGVLLLPLRHPSLVAKQVASLDYLAGGRVVLGVGVGGEGDKDFEAVQVPKNERGARTDEAIEVLRRLWTGAAASYEGRHYRFRDVVVQPPPARPGGPPVWVGGRSAAALRRAGRRGDGWLAYMVSTEGFAEGWSTVSAEAAARGRDGAVTPALMLPTCVADDADVARRQLSDHLSKRYGRPYERHVIERYCAAGTSEEVRHRVAGYAEAGLRHVVFLPGGPPHRRLEELERLASEVVTPLKGALV